MSLPNVELPEDLKKPIEEIKNPILKILIICLLLAVMTLASVLVYQNQNKDKNYREENQSLKNQLRECYNENKILINVNAQKDAEEIKRLQARDHYLDSVLTSLNSIKKTVDK